MSAGRQKVQGRRTAARLIGGVVRLAQWVGGEGQSITGRPLRRVPAPKSAEMTRHRRRVRGPPTRRRAAADKRPPTRAPSPNSDPAGRHPLVRSRHRRSENPQNARAPTPIGFGRFARRREPSARHSRGIDPYTCVGDTPFHVPRARPRDAFFAVQYRRK